MRIDDPARERMFGKVMYRSKEGRWIAPLQPLKVELDRERRRFVVIGFWSPQQSAGKLYELECASVEELVELFDQYEADPEKVMEERFGWEFDARASARIRVDMERGPFGGGEASGSGAPPPKSAEDLGL